MQYPIYNINTIVKNWKMCIFSVMYSEISPKGAGESAK